mmetsp:Transcript_26350/g.47291  ORF Transcript_26350/g.47291 Transcript_26350/m.47291 type:complete len:934 (-) Transcript_26350:220-3021(-)
MVVALCLMLFECAYAASGCRENQPSLDLTVCSPSTSSVYIDFPFFNSEYDFKKFPIKDLSGVSNAYADFQFIANSGYKAGLTDRGVYFEYGSYLEITGFTSSVIESQDYTLTFFVRREEYEHDVTLIRFIDSTSTDVLHIYRRVDAKMDVNFGGTVYTTKDDTATVKQQSWPKDNWVFIVVNGKSTTFDLSINTADVEFTSKGGIHFTSTITKILIGRFDESPNPKQLLGRLYDFKMILGSCTAWNLNNQLFWIDYLPTPYPKICQKYCSGNVCRWDGMCIDNSDVKDQELCPSLVCKEELYLYKNCQKCDPNTHIEGDLCACNDGYFDLYTDDTFKCIRCGVSLEATSQCQKCYGAAVLGSGIYPKCECISGYTNVSLYSNSISCKPCNYSDNTCLACYTYTFLYGNTCTCIPGFYNSNTADPTKPVCKPCHYACSTCAGPGPLDCITCSDLSARFNGDTGCVCGDGTYAFDYRCYPCMVNCKTCVEDTLCTSCKEKNADLTNGVCKCKTGLTTLTELPLSCKPCDAGYYYDSGACHPCFSSCYLCDSYPLCTECYTKYRLDSGICFPPDCQGGYYLSGSLCQPCYKLCLICAITGSNCYACIPEAELNTLTNTCKCREGYFETNEGCSPNLREVTATLFVETDDTLVITFSEPLVRGLRKSDAVLQIPDLKDFSYDLSQVSDYVYEIEISNYEDIEEGWPAYVTFIFPGELTDSTAELVTLSLNGILYYKKAMLTETEKEAERTKAYTSSVMTGVITTAVLTSAITGNLSSAFSVINTIQIIAFIPWCDLDLPLPLSAFLTSLLNFNLIPNVFQFFVPDGGPDTPARAKRVSIESHLFLMNGGELLTTLIAGLFYLPLALMLQKVIRVNMVKNYFASVVRDFRWNYFVKFCFEAQLEMTIAALMQMTALRASSISEIFNSILGCIAGVRVT